MVFSKVLPGFLRRQDSAVLMILMCVISSVSTIVASKNEIIGQLLAIPNCILCMYVLCRVVGSCTTGD